MKSDSNVGANVFIDFESLFFFLCVNIYIHFLKKNKNKTCYCSIIKINEWMITLGKIVYEEGK